MESNLLWKAFTSRLLTFSIMAQILSVSWLIYWNIIIYAMSVSLSCYKWSVTPILCGQCWSYRGLYFITMYFYVVYVFITVVLKPWNWNGLIGRYNLLQVGLVFGLVLVCAGFHKNYCLETWWQSVTWAKEEHIQFRSGPSARGGSTNLVSH